MFRFRDPVRLERSYQSFFGSEVKFLMRLTFADIMNRNKLLLLAFLVSIDV